MKSKALQNADLPFPLTPAEFLQDYRLAVESREASLLGRLEVLTGKAKFGIFGDGKELPQLAMARVFKKGDIRSGYYRDQTFMMATGMLTLREFFAQLYANTNLEQEPATAGRCMNNHFSTAFLSSEGQWKDLTVRYNSVADVSPTASQMPRLVGLGYASKLYRELPELPKESFFSKQGNEVAFGTIGNASCAEGMFWESLNAIGVLQVPVLLSIWDDEYGISVSNLYQLTKPNLSELLSGFQHSEDFRGYELYRVKAWDYLALLLAYQQAAQQARERHLPALLHIVEVTQPQGHSTSGSHERYKSKERLQWEKDFCCIKKMRAWLLQEKIAEASQLEAIEGEVKSRVESEKNKAWNDYLNPIQKDQEELLGILQGMATQSKPSLAPTLQALRKKVEELATPFRKDLMEAVSQALLLTRKEKPQIREKAIQWKREKEILQEDRYSSTLYSEYASSTLKVLSVPPVFSKDSEVMTGFNVLNRCFDLALKRDPRFIAFGEDVGQIGDVNQGFAGLQEKYGSYRVSDTGIRECTIIGQAIGMALRGLRPLAEIQYLDYILYALQIISDDVATLHYRTKGQQKVPLIIRTRGHRLEGIWHAGSPMAGILHLVRGVYVLVPRNMTIAAGFYNTLLQGDDPAIVVEVLNGYRLKETCPDNLGDFCLPLGVPEILQEGKDLTLVTYGACCRIALEAAHLLKEVHIDVEVIDVQTLLPFDLSGCLLQSLQKTNRIVFLDEDVPGGTTAYMLQEVLEKQKGYSYLDAAPKTISAKAHRTAYGTDGNYWSKPQKEHIFEAIYEMMHESDPQKYPLFYQ